MIDIADLYQVSIDRDYGHDEAFTVETREEAQRIAQEHRSDPDVRRIWVSGPDLEDHWSRS